MEHKSTCASFTMIATNPPIPVLCNCGAEDRHAVEYLDFLANHFAFRDWDYTRKHNIKALVYKDDKQNTIKYRVKRSFRWLFKKSFFKVSRLHMALYSLRKENHLPDGHLDGGNVITHWEETGEYLNMMQPTVGALLVNFLKEDPTHPHAKTIIEELKRLQKRYSDRIDNGDVS